MGIERAIYDLQEWHKKQLAERETLYKIIPVLQAWFA